MNELPLLIILIYFTSLHYVQYSYNLHFVQYYSDTILNIQILFGLGSYGSEFAQAISELFHVLTLSLIFVFYSFFAFIFYLVIVESQFTPKDPSIENFLETASAESYLTITPIVVILFMTTPTFALLYEEDENHKP